MRPERGLYTQATVFGLPYQQLQVWEELPHVAGIGDQVLVTLGEGVLLQHQGCQRAHALDVLKLSS